MRAGIAVVAALRLSGPTVLALVTKMQRQGLVSTTGQTFSLTPEGERLALQVVRAHRLLERYFADEARLPLRDIHAAAERKEHSLSTADVERLSAALGHPTLDPHGDPIPTREGAVAPASGTPATSWPIGTIGRIVHLEDEPEISFAQSSRRLARRPDRARHQSTPERLALSDGDHNSGWRRRLRPTSFLAPRRRGRRVQAFVRSAERARPWSASMKRGASAASVSGSWLYGGRGDPAGAAYVLQGSARVRSARHADCPAKRPGVASAGEAARHESAGRS